MGVGKHVGKIQPGFVANLVVTDGDYLDLNTRVTQVWISGKEKYLLTKFKFEILGKWELSFNDKIIDFEFLIENDKNKLNYGKTTARYVEEDQKSEILSFENNDNQISFSIQGL